MAALAAPEALCPDRRQRVLSLYYASPVRPLLYLLAQVAAVTVVMLLITLVPPLFLWAGNVGLAESPGAYFKDHAHTALRIAASGVDPAAPTGSIITMFGVKGGVGRTTLATNLAVALAQESSASVALVDLDVPFGDVALMLDIHPENDVLDALSDPVLDDLERLQKLLVRTPQGVHVLAAPLAPDDSGALDSSRVGRLLTRLAALHQFVLVDTPSGLTELTAAALDVSELAMLVTTPEVAALRRTHACLRLLQGLEFSTSKLQLVLNRAESKTRVSAAEAIEALGHPVVWRIANDYHTMQSSALGQPVVEAAPKAHISKDIQLIARQLAGAPMASRGSWLPWRRRTALVTA